MQKAKWLSEEALQIAEKRREAKDRGEKVRYKHLNAEFQRIARRDKKAFLMRRVDSLEKTLMLGGIGGRRRRGQQRIRCWMA